LGKNGSEALEKLYVPGGFQSGILEMKVSAISGMRLLEITGCNPSFG
jgi:hypothetical protein